MKVIIVNFETEKDKVRKATIAYNKLYFYLVRAKFALYEIISARDAKIQSNDLLRKEQERFIKWFGDINYVDTVYKNICDVIERFEDDNIELVKNDDKPKTFAFVYKNSIKLEIHLCTLFWQTKDAESKYDSGLGVILHELTHLVCGTNDYFYGKDKCLKNATEENSQCANNADSYEYYIEEFRNIH